MVETGATEADMVTVRWLELSAAYAEALAAKKAAASAQPQMAVGGLRRGAGGSDPPVPLSRESWMKSGAPRALNPFPTAGRGSLAPRAMVGTSDARTCVYVKYACSRLVEVFSMMSVTSG